MPYSGKARAAERRRRDHETVKGAHLAVILTEWPEFQTLDLKKLAKAMQSPTLVDLRNLYRPEDAQAAGLAYFPLGRPATK